MRAIWIALGLLCPTSVWAQATVEIVGPSAILEPSASSPSDRDGYPPISGAADPEEGTLAVRITVLAPIQSPRLFVVDDDADLRDDLRLDEAGATAAGTSRDVDDLDGSLDGWLGAGTYTAYFNLHKTGFDPAVPATSVTDTLRDDIERFTARLEGANVAPIVSPTFTVVLEGAASVSQNDLRWLETAPSEIRAVLGDRFVIRTKYSHQSAGNLDQLVLQSYYSGRSIRLERVDLYYYDTDGAAIASIATGVPAGFTASYPQTSALSGGQQPTTLSSGDRWVAEFTFQVVGYGSSSFVPYFQTKGSATGNWKVDSGYSGFGVEPPGQINLAELGIAKRFASGGRPVSGPEPPVVGRATRYELEIEVWNQGYDAASNVVVLDAVPSSASFVGGLSTTTGTVAWDAATRRLTWRVGGLAVDPDGPTGPGSGGRATLRFVVQVDPTTADVGAPMRLNDGATASGLSVSAGRTVTAGPTPPLSTTPVQAGAPLLDLRKTVSATSAQPGDRLTYTLDYKNDGNITALDVVLSDVLPPRTSFVSATAGGRYEPSSRTVSWTLPTLDAGETGAVAFTVQLDASFPSGTTAVSNRGSLSSANAASATSNEVTTLVRASPRVEVVKSVDRTTARPGATLVYTLAYSNTGVAPATGVTLEDPIPAEARFVSATGGGTLNSGSVRWTIGDLVPGASGSVQLTVQLDASFPAGSTWVRNRATATSVETGASLSNQVVTTVEAAPDLVITKTVDRATARPGERLSYTIELVNRGDAAASAVILTDPLPARTRFVSASDGGVLAGGSVGWTIGDLAAGASVRRTIVVQLDASFPAGSTTIANVVVVDAAEIAPRQSAPARTVVSAAPALTLDKTVDRATAAPGDTLVYTLRYANTGDADATMVVVDDTLPARTSFVSASGGVVPAGGQLRWSLGTVAAGASGTLSLTVRLDASFPAGRSLVRNVALIDADETAPIGSPTAETVVDAAPVLTLGKAVDQTTALPGGRLTYTLSLRNTGNAAASGVIVRDALPARTRFVSATGGGVVGGSVVAWSIGDLAVGQSLSLEVTVQLDTVFPSGTTAVTNRAEVDSSETDLSTSNPVTTQVTAGPLLVITKAVDRAGARPGELLTYTLSLRNDGTAAASGVVLEDTPPPRTSFVSATAGAIYDGSVVRWAIGDLAVGASTEVELVVALDRVFPAGSTTVRNAGLATSREGASATSNEVTTLVRATPRLAITKTADRSRAAPGDTVTWTLAWSNLGDADASGVEISDTLPARTSFVSATGGGSLSGGVVRWSLGAVAAGASGSVQLVVRLDPVFPSGATEVANLGVIDAIETTPIDSMPSRVTVDAAPSLSILKSVDRAAAAPGDTLTYTLEYRNDGDAVASGVVLSDALPARSAFVSASGGGTVSGSTVSWSLGDVAPGTSASVQLVVRLDAVFPAGVTTVRNVAVIDGREGDPVASNPVTTTLSAEPVLELVKSVDRVAALPGELLSYTLRWQNRGAADASGVVLSDALPARTSFVSATAGGTLVGGVVRWAIGAVPVGASGSVQLVVRLDPVFPRGTTAVPNGGSIVSNETSATPSNLVVTSVSARPAISVVKTVDRAQAAPGDTLVYELTVRNLGNAADESVRLVDPLPPRTRFVSTLGGGSLVGSQVEWPLGSLAPGASVAVRLTVALDTVFPAGLTRVENSATARGASGDTQSNVVETEVTAAPRLEVTKQARTATATPGELVTYVLGFTNLGDADASGVVLADTLPARTRFVAASDGGRLVGGRVEWTIGDLAAGASGSRSLTVQLDAVFPAGETRVVNVAVLSDPGGSVRSPDTVVTVTASPRLAVVKSVVETSERTISISNVAVARSTTSGEVRSAPVVLGGSTLATIRYRIEVTNQGDAPASAVTVEDALPAGTDFASASAGGSYDATRRLVRWSTGDLEPGASTSVELTVTVR